MTCDPRNQRFDVYGLRSGKDGSHRLTGIIKIHNSVDMYQNLLYLIKKKFQMETCYFK